MPFQIIHRDITVMDTDAIVNPTDACLSGSGGTDYAVHCAAGKEMDMACADLIPLQTGTVAVTDAYALPCRYVFHTVGPVWHGGARNEETLLRSCYLNALLTAKKMGLSSVAFPLISSGTFGFPKNRVLRIAVAAIEDFLYTTDGELQVYICILERDAYILDRAEELRRFLERNREPLHDLCAPQVRFSVTDRTEKPEPETEAESSIEDARFVEACIEETCDEEPFYEHRPVCGAPTAPYPGFAKIPLDLADWIGEQDDSFAVTLLKLIDKKGMTDVQCYKKANVSKGTFWKINNDPKYKPSKATVIAFAIALELDIDETDQLLRTVGFSLSRSNTFDMIIRFFILNRNYDIFEINSALFQYDQVCLGC